MQWKKFEIYNIYNKILYLILKANLKSQFRNESVPQLIAIQVI
jgi:hypothetical protein